MKLLVNNKETETQASHLGELASELQLPSMGVAIAVSNRLIPRTEWDQFALAEGMSVVIIKAACGG